MPAQSQAPATTSAQVNKRPRHYAVELVGAWVEGESIEPVLAKAPPEFRELIKSIGRAWCLQIKHHHKHGTEARGQLGAWLNAYRDKKRAR